MKIIFFIVIFSFLTSCNMTHDSHNPEAIQSQETTSINENMEKIWVDVRQAEEWAE